MLDAYTLSLAREYIAAMDAPRSGQAKFHDFDHFASERSVLHEQLLQALGKAREDDFGLEAWAREAIRL